MMRAVFSLQHVVAVFGAALGAAALLTPVLRSVALRSGWVDRPGARKSHRVATPLLGGVAIYAAVILAMALLPGSYAIRELGGLLVGASVVSLCGLWDDRRPLGPATKVVVQALAATFLMVTGVHVALPVPMLANLALTLLWVVGVTNALNLLDNVDGLAGGIASIAAFFFLVLAVLNGQYLVGSLAAALVGACLGFLLYNFNPATIFMGDSGSLFLGFLLAGVGIKLRFPDNVSRVTWLVPILVLGVALLDTALVCVTRWQRGVNPLTTPGLDHLSHRLIVVGLTPRGAVGVLYGAAVVLGIAAVVVSRADGRTAYPLALGLGLVAAVALVWLTRRSRRSPGAPR
jgi:UDP-GlcNAc:undecaprenyl-phosphate/decaprenyl-phosphate GlcNAc-1-phosphate transferase